MYSIQPHAPSKNAKHLFAAIPTVFVLGVVPILIGYVLAYRSGPVQDGWLYFSMFCSCLYSSVITGLCIFLPMRLSEHYFGKLHYWPWLAVPLAAVTTGVAAALMIFGEDGAPMDFGDRADATLYGLIGAVIYAATLSYLKWRRHYSTL